MSAPPHSHAHRRRGVWLLLTLVLLAGLGLRVWYASWDRTDQRYWDEQYSLDNVRPIMLERTFLPARAYYPSPVFTLPAAVMFEGSAALGRWVDRPDWAPMEGGRFTSTAILLARLLMTLYGTLTVVLVFLIGRHIGSSRVGLLAAAAIAFSPWMIHASGYYKPDALLVMAVTLAFFASLRAITPVETVDSMEGNVHDRWARIRWYVLAGISIALAMSAKLTGGLAAVPLIVATAHCGLRDRGWLGRLGRLVLAGVVSVVTFVTLNPYWRHYLFFLSGLKRDYAMRADWVDDSKLGMPGRVAGMIVDDYGHGLIWGTLALVGLAAFAWRWGRRLTVQRGGSAAVTMAGAMMLGFVGSYVAAYALQTSYFKGNNFLPLLPFTALAAAWSVDAGLRYVAAGRPRLAGTWGHAIATVLVVALVAPAGLRYVYQSVTPTTHDAALRFLARKADPTGGRLMYAERGPRTKTPWEGRQPFAGGNVGLLVADDLSMWSREHLRTTDGLVFLAQRGTPAERVARQRWLEGIGPHKKTLFEPKLFQLRGPPLWAVFHRWSQVPPPLVVAESESGIGPSWWFKTPWPHELTAEDFVSLAVWIPHVITRPKDGWPRFDLGDRVLPMIHLTTAGSGDIYVTDRFTVGDLRVGIQLTMAASTLGATTARLTIPIKQWDDVLAEPVPPPTINVHIHRWQSP